MELLRKNKWDKLVALLLIFLFLFTGCGIKTNIKPYYPEQPICTPKEKTVFLYVTGVSSETFVRACAPAGNCFPGKNTDGIKEIVTQTAKMVLMDKGYKVSVSQLMPSGGDDHVFLISIENVDFKWQSGMLHSEAELFMRIRHQVLSPSGQTLLDYTFEKSGKEGELLGNCCFAGAGFTIVGVIPAFIYLGIVGDEATQLTRAGNKYLKEYAEDLALRISKIL